MSESVEPILNRFREAASGFIRAVDSVAVLERNSFLAAVAQRLADLYSAALLLPSVEPGSDEIDEEPFDREKWSGLFQTLRDKVGTLDGYWTVFDATERSEPIQASLAADLSEIYDDLQRDLALEAKGVGRADLMWELRESFREHWSRHALDALKALRDQHI